jgi:hypothetical protein
MMNPRCSPRDWTRGHLRGCFKSRDEPVTIVIASDLGVTAISAGVAGLVALVVAVLTAVTTNRRQREQLNEARRSQKREVKARAKAQRRELRHARRLADLDDLRAILDDATLALAEAKTVTFEVEAKVKYGAMAAVARASEAQKELDGVRTKTIPIRARLEVRLGVDDEVTVAFSSADSALLSMSLHATLLSTALSGTDRKRNQETFEEHAKHLHIALKAFAEAAVKRVGTVLPT